MKLFSQLFESVPVEARIIPIWETVLASRALKVALVLGLLTSVGETRASTGPSTTSGWNDQPAWAVPSESTAPRKLSKRSSYVSDVSPFSPGSNNIAIDVGQVFLMGDLGDKYNDSIGFQAHYTYGVSDLFAFDASAGYSGHGDFSMTTLLAGLRTNLSWYDKVIPYLTFGLGFYRPSYQENHAPAGPGLVATTTTLAPVLFGIHLGPGVDLELTKQIYFGTALTFHDVFGTSRDSSTGLQREVGGTYTSFLLHVGYTF